MEHGSCVPQGTEVVQTGFHYTLSLIGGKYKMAILYLLARAWRTSPYRRGEQLRERIVVSLSLHDSVWRDGAQERTFLWGTYARESETITFTF